MAHIVLLDPHALINAVDLSTHIRQITINYTAEIQDDTTSSTAGVRDKLPGLIDWNVEIEFSQDYAASQIDDTLFSLIGAAAFAVVFRSQTAAIGVTNPEYTGNALLETYSPIAGSVGEVNTTSCTLQGTGALARATS